MKTLFVVLVVALAGAGIAMVPEASAHACAPGTFLTLPINFSYDTSHGPAYGHTCVFVGNTAVLS